MSGFRANGVPRCAAGSLTGLCAVWLLASSACAAPAWQAMVAPNGSVRLERNGKEFGTLEPGLFEAGWRGGSFLQSPPGTDAPGGVCVGRLRAPGGAEVVTELRAEPVADGVRLSYRLSPAEEVRLDSLHVGLTVPASILAGGRFRADGVEAAFPAVLRTVALRAGPLRTLELIGRDGSSLTLAFDAPTPTLVQDDRQWGPSFSIRLGVQNNGGQPWPAGKPLDVQFTITAKGGIALEFDGPTTIEAGEEWIPLDAELDIQPGSALDLSRLVTWHAPAGKLGRVVAGPGGSLAFQRRPQTPVRFYGANLCFSAHMLTHSEADRLAQRLRRLGYNAVRFHHYESSLVDRSQGSSTRLDPAAMDKFDYLFAALKRQGIYVTTDLFVSRPVFAREVWEGAEGDVGMDEFKMAVPVNERAFANFRAFAVALLSHRNPHTGLRYAEDPALAWLHLINEGNPGNFLRNLSDRVRSDWTRAWNAWLERRYPDPNDRRRALGEGDGPDQTGAVPLPAGPDESPRGVLCSIFLADTEQRFFERTRRFLRSELGCRALLSNMNGWTNPIQAQAARRVYDYVDDHFYVDHPEFIEQPWRLPSRCPNTSPVAQGAPGGRHCAFVRLFDRPFTLSEFNYSGPGRFRGVGGILTGALGAVQDWSVIWRFAYSHNRENLFEPRPAGYFDLATDPLSLASDRASLCLFLRGDMRPAPHAVAIAMRPGDLLNSTRTARSVAPPWNGLALVTRVGTLLGSPDAATEKAMLVLRALPTGESALDPYSGDAGEGILAEMRRRRWLPPHNRTNMATSCYQSETNELTVDAPNDVLTLDTARTAGGYAPAGATIRTRSLTVAIEETGATVWVSSVDGAPLSESRRLLITHLTDLQNSGARYGDRARKVLLEWGHLPYLVRAGRATVTLRLKGASRARVWGLSVGGRRLGRVDCRVVGGALVIPLTVNDGGKARMLYEVEVPSAGARGAD